MRARPRRTPWIPPALLAVVPLLLAGCAHRVMVPPQPPRPAPGYSGRVDSLAVGPGALAGLKIALDPGHGGVFRGVVGLHGLSEAEVNLGVALMLRDLLAAHGATVFLTRDRDRDFLSPADSALRVDLAERSRLANGFAPDLFVSIHHNAEPGGRRDVNETQTYYKLGDDGPSLDAATDLHRSLKRNVGIAKDKVVPGNYFVLRNSECPAVLTETSYLSDPDVEALLADSSRRRIEAEALFLGIARWSARARPTIAGFEAMSARDEPDTLFEGATEPRLEARIAGEFDDAVLALDGAPVPLARDGARLRWAPATPLAAGPHEAVLAVRLAGGGAATPRRLRFAVRRPAARLRAMLEESLVPGTMRRLVALRIEALDASGNPSPDSLRLRVRRVLGRGLEPAETLVVVRDGVAWAYLRGVAPPTVQRRAARSARAAAAAPAIPSRTPARARVEVVAARGAAPSIAPIEVALEASSAAPGLGPGSQSLPYGCEALAMPAGVPLTDAPGTREPVRALGWLHRDGFARVTLDTTGRADAPAPAGYRLWPAGGASPSIPRAARTIPPAPGRAAPVPPPSTSNARGCWPGCCAPRAPRSRSPGAGTWRSRTWSGCRPRRRPARTGCSASAIAPSRPTSATTSRAPEGSAGRSTSARSWRAPEGRRRPRSRTRTTSCSRARASRCWLRRRGWIATNRGCSPPAACAPRPTRCSWRWPANGLRTACGRRTRW